MSFRRYLSCFAVNCTEYKQFEIQSLDSKVWIPNCFALIGRFKTDFCHSVFQVEKHTFNYPPAFSLCLNRRSLDSCMESCFPRCEINTVDNCRTENFEKSFYHLLVRTSKKTRSLVTFRLFLTEKERCLLA